MILKFGEEESGPVIEADAEGIEWLRTGLEQLDGALPGEELSSPALSENGVGEVVLRRR
jgi:hypothetical protein